MKKKSMMMAAIAMTGLLMAMTGCNSMCGMKDGCSDGKCSMAETKHPEGCDCETCSMKAMMHPEDCKCEKCAAM